MNPSNLALTKLAAVCDRLAKSGRLTPADSKEARDISDEWVVLVDMSGSRTFAEAEPKRHMEARAKAWVAQMISFLEGQLFPPVQVNTIQGQSDNPDLDFRPVEIIGEPLSATILRERR
jgi:hypothetical protein